MSNGNVEVTVYDRLYKLQAGIGKLILDKKRDPDEVAKIYQAILDDAEIKIRPKRRLSPFLGVKVPASTEDFLAVRHFCHSKDESKPKFIFGDSFNAEDNFGYFFLQFGGKVESPQGPTAVDVYQVQRIWTHREIIDHLGGETKVEITLRELYFLVQQQPDGRPGILVVENGENIFFVRDSLNRLHTVIFHWDKNHWQVDSPTGLIGISDGCQVFSRGSLEVPMLEDQKKLDANTF